MPKEMLLLGKVAIAGVVSFFATISVAYWGLLGLMTLDTVFGFLVAWKDGGVSAKVLGQGLTKKLGILILLAGIEIMFFVLGIQAESKGIPIPESAFSWGGTAGVIWFCGVELTSIVEFADVLKIPIPGWMRDGLAKLKTAADVKPIDPDPLPALKK